MSGRSSWRARSGVMRQADQAARVAGHEVHRLGGAVRGGDAHVAFVLAVLVVGEDHHAAGAKVLDPAADARQDVVQGRSIAHCRRLARLGAT